MFDRVVVVDWSSAGRPVTGRDSVWVAAATRGGGAVESWNPPTRAQAEELLQALTAAALDADERLLIGVDVAFGYPAGFARALTGEAGALSVWEWLEARISDDARNRNNRFQVAAAINRALPGVGPFWFRPAGLDLPDLPPKGSLRTDHAMAELRVVETRARGAQSVWKLGGAGSVGGQALTALPVLWRLRSAAGGGRVAAWPLEAGWREAQVVLAEVYPALLRQQTATLMRKSSAGTVRDAVQVRLLAEALLRLGDGIEALLEAAVSAAPLPEEGWILGVGAEESLRAVAAEAAEAAATVAGAGLDATTAGEAAPDGGAVHPALIPPRLRNDCFAMPQGVSWVPVDAALARLRAALVPIRDTEDLPVAAAGGRILAVETRARRANPPCPNAAVDGYGFAHSALAARGPHEFPLLDGRAAAGQPFGRAVQHATAVRILTGAILPEGVDTVVLDEDCATDGRRVAFDGPIRAGANTRRAGEDIGEGAVALPAGRRLTAPDLALLSALGVGRVRVLRQLRVAVLSTGDELLADPGAQAAAHQIFDANRPMLLEVLRRWGYAPVDLGCAPDDAAQIAARLDRGAREADVILTSGGASAGDEDHVSRLLRAHGQLSSWRIALKPGRPLALALWPSGAGDAVGARAATQAAAQALDTAASAVPVIGLPGNPVAALVCTLVFARPALSLLSGAGWSEPLAMTVPAAFSKQKKPGRREYLRARINGAGAAEVFASEGSGRISGLCWAEGLVELPDGAATIAPGDQVRYLPYAGFGLG